MSNEARLALDAELSPEDWALAAIKEELIAGAVLCEERFLGKITCDDPANKLVRLPDHVRVYPCCPRHAALAVTDLQGVVVFEVVK